MTNGHDPLGEPLGVVRTCLTIVALYVGGLVMLFAAGLVVWFVVAHLGF